MRVRGRGMWRERENPVTPPRETGAGAGGPPEGRPLGGGPGRAGSPGHAREPARRPPRGLGLGSGSRRSSGLLLALLSTLIWAGNLATARELRDAIPPVSLAFWRCALAVVVILPWTARPLRREWPTVRRHLPLLSLIGLCGIAAFTVLVYVAAHTTTATNLSLLDIAASVLILAFARLTGQERLGLPGVLGSALAVAGVVALVTRGSFRSLDPHPGDLWMLGAAVIFAVYCLLLRVTPAALSQSTLLFVTFATSLVLLFPAYLVERWLVGGFRVTPELLAALAYVGVLSSAVAYLCWNQAVRQIGAASAGVVYYLLPVMTALLSVWLLDEPVTLDQGLAMVLIVSGVALGLHGARRAGRT
ncbi:DMT family transporter [Streptomyces sp. NPDC057702]|uniref:DMT family transporter n=1 Tax=unclassified Streptomyces TaxID=2593676 RepID=UPI0036A03566